MLLHSISCHCVLFNGIKWYWIVLHGAYNVMVQIMSWYCKVLHFIARHPIVLHGIVWYLIVLHWIDRYFIVLNDIAWCCVLLNGIALYWLINLCFALYVIECYHIVLRSLREPLLHLWSVPTSPDVFFCYLLMQAIWGWIWKCTVEQILVREGLA